MTITTRLYTAFNGTKVGTDVIGNSYFKTKSASHPFGEKRWVVYPKRNIAWWQWLLIVPILATNRLNHAEPSLVSPEWHGWLHYTLELPPTQRDIPQHSWQQSPRPNYTGTQLAYAPSGHLLNGGKRAANTADYEPWQP